MNLFTILNFDEFKREHQLQEATLVDFCTGFDSCVYLLFSKSPSPRIEGKFYGFCNPIANAVYTTAKIVVDWDAGKIISAETHILGQHRVNYHYIRPLCDDYLLLGARCNRGITYNALVVDKAGDKKYEMYLGDAIEDCITTMDGRIITSYFDEGMIGIGSSGLIMWDAAGRKLWENKRYMIRDCYAMNIDDSGTLWFYYYSDFKLVRTDFFDDLVMDPEVSGAHAFSISKSLRNLIFSGGYNDDDFYFCKFDDNSGRLENKEKAKLILDNKVPNITSCYFRGSKLLFVADGTILCGACF